MFWCVPMVRGEDGEGGCRETTMAAYAAKQKWPHKNGEYAGREKNPETTERSIFASCVPHLRAGFLNLLDTSEQQWLRITAPARGEKLTKTLPVAALLCAKK